MRYRRADVTGATYFFPVNLAERKRTLLVDYVDTLREAMRMIKAKHPFNIDAMVILPDHLTRRVDVACRRLRLSDAVDADQGRLFATDSDG